MLVAEGWGSGGVVGGRVDGGAAQGDGGRRRGGAGVHGPHVRAGRRVRGAAGIGRGLARAVLRCIRRPRGRAGTLTSVSLHPEYPAESVRAETWTIRIGSLHESDRLFLKPSDRATLIGRSDS